MELVLAMKMLIYPSVLSVVFVTVLGDDLSRCPPIVHQKNDFVKSYMETCYMFINTEKYWTDARKDCWDLGGDLLEVDDESTMIFIRGVLNGRELGWSRNGVWLGAHDRRREGHWTWASGRPMKYSYWSGGQPSSILGLSLEDCACMRKTDNWQWHDFPCESLGWKYNFICQFPYVKGGSDTGLHTGARKPDDEDDRSLMIAFILGSICLLVIVLALVFFFYCNRRRKKSPREDEPPQFENLSYEQLRQAEINENAANMACFTTNQMNSLYEEVNKPVDHGVNYYSNMTGAGACGGAAASQPKVTNIEAASKENNAANEKVLEKPPKLSIVNNQLYDVDKDPEAESAVPLSDTHDDDHVYEDMQ